MVLLLLDNEMTERKIVDVESSYYVSFDEFDYKTPDQIIEGMKLLKEEIGDRDVYFFFKPYGYDGGVTLELYERRLENDKEYAKRIAIEDNLKRINKQKKAQKDARDLAEYERLKKKFGE